MTSVPMTDPCETVVERAVDLEATPDEVWALLVEPKGWLADEGTLDVRPGGAGRLVEDGVVRRAVVDVVDEGRRLVYRWWDERGDGGDASRVEITVVPSPGPTRLVVRETRLLSDSGPVPRGPRGWARAGLRWEVRLACLAFLRAPARV